LHDLFHPAKQSEQATAKEKTDENADSVSHRKSTPAHLESNRLRLMSLLAARFHSRPIKWLDCENGDCSPHAERHVQVEIAPVDDDSRFAEAVSLCADQLRACRIDKVIVDSKSAGTPDTYFVTSSETAPSETEMMIPLMVSDIDSAESPIPSAARAPLKGFLRGYIDPCMHNLLAAIGRNRLREGLNAELVCDQAITRAVVGESIADQISDLTKLSKNKTLSPCQRTASETFIAVLNDLTGSDKLSTDKAKADAAKLYRNLPDSMYRDEALKLLAAKTDSKTNLSNKPTEDSQALWGMAFITAIVIALLPVDLVFLVVLTRFWLAPKPTPPEGTDSAGFGSSEEPVVRYGWARTLAVYGWQMVSLILVLLFQLAAGINNEFESTLEALRTPLVRAFYELISNLIINSTVFFAYFKFFLPEGITFQDAFGLYWRTNRYSAKQLVLFGIAGWLAVDAVTAVCLSLLAFFHHPETPPGAPATLAKTVSAGAWFIIFVAECVLGPVFEELCFRGVLYRSLRTMWGVFPSLIVSSLLFAILHGEVAPWLLFHKFAVGAVNALMYEKTKSLTPAIISHCLNNTFVALI
jgi:membrane protease YdiL (CAAX protease family)